jgi:hypothetical protein
VAWQMRCYERCAGDIRYSNEEWVNGKVNYITLIRRVASWHLLGPDVSKPSVNQA